VSPDAALRKAVEEYLAADREVRNHARQQNTYTGKLPQPVQVALRRRQMARDDLVVAAVRFVKGEEVA
jgi:hypothetical protein